MPEAPPRIELRTDFTVRTWVREDGSASLQVIGNRTGRYVEVPIAPANGFVWVFSLVRALITLGAWSTARPEVGNADRELAEDRTDFFGGAPT